MACSVNKIDSYLGFGRHNFTSGIFGYSILDSRYWWPAGLRRAELPRNCALVLREYRVNIIPKFCQITRVFFDNSVIIFGSFVTM